MRHAVQRLAVAALLAGCDSPTTEGPPAGARPTSAELVSGEVLRGLPGTPMSQPVTVRVLTGQAPAPGVVVRFAAERGGAFAPAEATTDAQGMARSTWTLGDVGMIQPARAEVPVLQRAFPLTGVVDSTRTLWLHAPATVAPGAEFDVELYARMDSVPYAPMGPNRVLVPQNAGLVSGTLGWGTGAFELVSLRGGRVFSDIERATLVVVPGPQGVAVTAMEPRAPTPVGPVRVWVARLRAAPAAPGRRTLAFALRDFLSARQFASVKEHVHVVGAEVVVQ